VEQALCAIQIKKLPALLSNCPDSFAAQGSDRLLCLLPGDPSQKGGEKGESAAAPKERKRNRIIGEKCGSPGSSDITNKVIADD
jgi:hypothetical protein